MRTYRARDRRGRKPPPASGVLADMQARKRVQDMMAMLQGSGVDIHEAAATVARVGGWTPAEVLAMWRAV